MQITFNRWTLSLTVLVLLALVGLASVTVYNFLDASPRRTGGVELSYGNSSSTREQEQQKLIQMSEERLSALQKENSDRKKDVEDLQARVTDLSNNIKSLQQLAKELESRLPNGTGSYNPPGTPGAP